MLGVAASATPAAEAVAVGEARGFLHSGQWWGLYLASTVLVLACYAAILRQQLARARGAKPTVLDSLRRSFAGLLPMVGVVLPCSLLLLPGLVLGYTAGWVGVPVLLAGVAALMYFAFGIHALLDEGLAPLAALRRSVALVRGNALATAGLLAAALAAVLVFVMLTGILMAVAMNLAGRDAQTSHAGLTFSRWLMAGVLALPVVYAGAVSVSAWRTLTRKGPANGA